MHHRTSFLISLTIWGCAGSGLGSAQPQDLSSATQPVGVLVMAHGGSAEWNKTIASAIKPLAARVPTALALGMADPVTLRAALDSLRGVGATRVAVVRMFISGTSFLDRTKYLLGLSPTPPARLVPRPGHDDNPPPQPILHRLSVATHSDGLMASPEARIIVTDRARAVSTEPAEESVLLLAHGMGQEEANGRLLEAMNEIANHLSRLGFFTVETAALREDWPAKRATAVSHIRSFVRQEATRGRRVLVLPFRLSGFGPYADVLHGLSYESGHGLLPHRQISAWLQNTAAEIVCANRWQSPIADCDHQ